MVNDRYSRQEILSQIGVIGQKKIFDSKIVIIGCGATGSVSANNLTRAGVGKIKIIDRDIVELNNLQRQLLFDEKDIKKPKASVAKDKLTQINSEIEIIPINDHLNHKNIENIIKNNDLVLDCTDNMETRFLINDACVKNNIPWIYCGVIDTYGMTYNIIPNKPCFRCLFPNLPPSGLLPTCDTSGILNTIPLILASIQSTEALKILLGKEPNNTLIIYDVWHHSYHSLEVKKNPNCKCCNEHDYEFLNTGTGDIVKLCGKNSIIINPTDSSNINFFQIKEKLDKICLVEGNDIILRFKINEYEFTLFKNGRAIIEGTDDEKIARSLYSKYIGT